MDTNVLLSISGTRPDGRAEYQRNLEAIESLISRGYAPCVAFQNLVEFYVVATRPKDVNGHDLDAETASGLIRDFLDAYPLLEDNSSAVSLWLELCEKKSAVGKVAHDLRLAATALGNGIRFYLSSNRKDFGGLPGLELLTPDDVLELQSAQLEPKTDTKESDK